MPWRRIMTAETRAIVDAVIEALALPYAATVGGEETRQEILAERIRHLTVSMEALAEGAPPLDIAWHLAYLRERLAEHPPIGYVTAEQARERVQQGASWPEAVALPDAAVTS